MDTSELAIGLLAQQCAEHTRRFYRGETADTAYCFELLRRVFEDGADNCFFHIHRIYSPQVLKWVKVHPQFPHTGEEAEYFANAAFSNFYFALHGSRFARFESLAQILKYLKLCVHTAVAQYARKPLPETYPLETDTGFEPSSDSNPTARIEAAEVWARVAALLPDADDRLLVHCIYVQALKPAQVSSAYPEKWEDSRRVSVALQRIKRTLRRDDVLRRLAAF